MIPAHFPASISGTQAFSCKFLRSGCHGYVTQLKGSNESAVERQAYGFQSHTFLCFALIENMQSALPMEAKPSEGSSSLSTKGRWIWLSLHGPSHVVGAFAAQNAPFQ